MKNNIKVVNVKCNWCANTIKKELSNLWIKNIEIWFTKNDSYLSRNISFYWDDDIVRKKLTELWYPKLWTKEANSIIKKAKSFISCAIWKV